MAVVGDYVWGGSCWVFDLKVWLLVVLSEDGFLGIRIS